MRIQAAVSFLQDSRVYERENVQLLTVNINCIHFLSSGSHDSAEPPGLRPLLWGYQFLSHIFHFFVIDLRNNLLNFLSCRRF